MSYNIDWVHHESTTTKNPEPFFRNEIKDYPPYLDCENCPHYKECAVKQALKEARETIFNIGREKSGRTDFMYNGRIERD